MFEKIDAALNESRILVLVAQVILGFQYQAFFQPGFEKLPRYSQDAKMVGLGLMLVALVLLISPAAYHRIIEKGHLSGQFRRFITRVAMLALLPFALGLGADVFVVAARVFDRGAGVLAACVAVVTSLFFWYGIEAFAAGREPRTKEKPVSENSEQTPLPERIKCVMTEARVVLPGAQALLGFQFAAVLTEAFDRLAPSVKYVHLGGIACIALSTILLMAPAAFHRIVEKGEDTERLHTFSSYMVVAAMLFLAPGIASDVFVIMERTVHNTATAAISAGITLTVFYGWWFGYMLYRRDARSRTEDNTRYEA